MVVVLSGPVTTGVGLLEGAVVVIFGSGAGGEIVGKLAGTLVVVGRIAGETLLVVVVGTGAG